MAVVDIAGFIADLKDHAAEHGFHVHDERHFVETYSMRQAFEVDLHPEAACGGPLDLPLSLDLEPRTLMAFEDEVMSISDDAEPSDDLVVQIMFTWALPPLEHGPDLLVLSTELAGIGGPDLPIEVSAIDSFAAVTDAPQRTLSVTARLETPLAAMFMGGNSTSMCDALDRSRQISEYLLDRNETIRVGLEYSGGDAFDILDPLGFQDDNQIVVLTSSYNRSAGIAMEMDHFRSEFPRIEVDHSRSVVKVETWLLSAFGNDDLQSETWELEVGGVSTGTSATVGDGILLDDDGEGLRVGWEWAYGDSGAPSDTYLLTASCGDIQGNQWESTGDEKLHLVVQQHQLDNILSWEDVAVNGLVNSSSVVEGSDFTLTVLARTSGDAAINGYPLTVDVYYSFEGGEFILLEDDFAWLSPQMTAFMPR